ncbi:hypothetical protein AVEN_1522-1 [Araneus ventricosus]|uniref:Uncharacterized protein n=1 Tax=Araneus ventricosus TaxID=182803 RepID=A0A4Y2FBU4_ARAVE|nr:hypothetical protein AVEN_1522-1 [Araneus ventricosus]
MARTTPELAAPSPNFLITAAGGHFSPHGFSAHQAVYTAALRWKRVSNLEPSGPEVETLPPCHRGLRKTKLFHLISMYNTDKLNTKELESIRKRRIEKKEKNSYTWGENNKRVTKNYV